MCELEEVTGTAYTSINIIGGGSRNDFLNQCSANVTQRRVIAGPVETSSIGNAAVQMISLGWIEDLQAARKIIARSEDVTYYEPKTTVSQDLVHFFNGLHKHECGG